MPVARARAKSRKSASKNSSFIAGYVGLKKPVILAILVLASTIGAYVALGASAASGNQDVVTEASKFIGIAEKPNGCNCGGKKVSGTHVNGNVMSGVNIDDFTGDYSPYKVPASAKPWCAYFVSYVYHYAGHGFGTNGTRATWSIGSSVALEHWFQNHSKANFWYANASSPAPQPGDVIFFASNGGGPSGAVDHVGLAVSESGTTLNTIQGNYSNAVLRANVLNFRKDPTIVGWGQYN
jgi:cell wall-associated NlpC family hydrolase